MIYLQQNPDIPYFKMELPNGKSLVHLLGPKERFNLQFGRYVYICSFNRRKKKPPQIHLFIFYFRLVIANVLGNPEREDWKACSQTEEEEKENAIAFKKAFQPFDFSLLE